jgi:hypothetical protein
VTRGPTDRIDAGLGRVCETTNRRRDGSRAWSSKMLRRSRRRRDVQAVLLGAVCGIVLTLGMTALVWWAVGP